MDDITDSYIIAPARQYTRYHFANFTSDLLFLLSLLFVEKMQYFK